MSHQSTLDERGQKYGDYGNVAHMTQLLQRNLRQGVGWEKLTDVQRTSADMIAHKLARVISGGDPNYADNWHDIGGYALLAEERCSKPGD